MNYFEEKRIYYLQYDVNYEHIRSKFMDTHNLTNYEVMEKIIFYESKDVFVKWSSYFMLSNINEFKQYMKKNTLALLDSL